MFEFNIDKEQMFGYNLPKNRRSEVEVMKNKRKYVLKNKKRFVSLIITILAIIFIAVFSDISYGFNENTYKTLVFKSGDTLWDIAKQYKNDGDIRKFVFDIKKLNDLKSSSLVEGSEIKIPMY
jgi:predicted RNA-binding protein associated with RNAse of E/G family